MRVSRRRHVLHAALFWGVTGTVLGFFGFKWVLAGFNPPAVYFLLAAAFLLGGFKGEVAIGRAGKKAIARIQTLPDLSPFYLVFTGGQWALVFGMMLLGMAIRFSGIDKSWRGLVLLTVGTALLWGSRHFWKSACCGKAACDS